MSHTPGQSTLGIEKVSARIGAVVTGIDARQDLTETQKDHLRSALVKYKVIFLRAQHLDDVQHEKLSRVFGEPVLHPTIPAAEGTSYTFELKSKSGRSTDSWHTDVTFVPAYPKASILRAIEIPPYGGSTIWANTAAAYDALPEPLQAFADRLWAVHSNDYDTNFSKLDRKADEIAQFRAAFISKLYETEHPVVRVHPESGERTLVLGHFVKGLVGFATRDANKIVEILQGYVTEIENTVRWIWTPGDVAVWDNRATQHYAPADFDLHGRKLQRITVAGNVPVAVDRRTSRLMPGPDDGKNIAH